jgi:Bacterial regulatory helix-turn-helix protein, lysR family
MQNLEPILIFVTVAEMRSFTHAADSLGIQKGRASMAVRKLEKDVGVRLLHRTTRSVQLTEDGTLMNCTQCSQAIEWRFAGAYGSICRASWRAHHFRSSLAGLHGDLS